MGFSLLDLAERLNGRIQGLGDRLFRDVAPLDRAGSDELAYAESRKQLAALRQSRAGAVLVDASLAAALGECSDKVLIVVDQPHAAFIAAMLLFRPQRTRRSVGHSDRAGIAATAKLGADCNVFAHAEIGANVTIGDRCDIGSGVIIGDGCVIGDDCVLHAHTVLYPGVQLGNRVIVHANSVIGADGFGYRFVNGAFVKIPHTGTVIIEDDVEIGACSTIDRGMIGATLVGRGTKLDNQVMVAHNCRVGRHNVFASQVGLAGSVTTGDYVQMGGQVGIADHVQIGKGVKLGGKAGVMDNLTEPGVYHGIPAMQEKDAIKKHLAVQKLPDLREQVKQLRAQVAELEEQLATLNNKPKQQWAA